MVDLVDWVQVDHNPPRLQQCQHALERLPNIENMLQSTLRYARLLRSLGAEAIVVITPQGLDCGKSLSSEMSLPIHKVNFGPKAKVCDLQSALGVYLTRLPPHLVDVVVGGRNHQKVANYVN
mgnify:CR=1 FL=1